jgi:hypothetical protein
MDFPLDGCSVQRNYSRKVDIEGIAFWLLFANVQIKSAVFVVWHRMISKIHIVKECFIVLRAGSDVTVFK